MTKTILRKMRNYILPLLIAGGGVALVSHGYHNTRDILSPSQDLKVEQSTATRQYVKKEDIGVYEFGRRLEKATPYGIEILLGSIITFLGAYQLSEGIRYEIVEEKIKELNERRNSQRI